MRGRGQRQVPLFLLGLSVVAAATACTPAGPAPEGDPAKAEQAPQPESAVDQAERAPRQESAIDRIEQVEREIAAWRTAPDLAAARRHAEAARNLIVGPSGPGYGDSDGDGQVAGANRIGLLPGLSGGAALALPAANSCVERNLLGGDWSDPERRWAVLAEKIEAWRPDNNLFPTLPSHAQRIVGWAELALRSDGVDEARDHAGHAAIHSRVSRQALTDC